MSMIEIQDAYVARVAAAHSKMGKRSAGLVFARTKRAARREATSQLARLGYDEAAVAQIVKDAHDMFLLEAGAKVG